MADQAEPPEQDDATDNATGRAKRDLPWSARFPWVSTALILALIVALTVPDLIFDRIRRDLPRDELAAIEEQVRNRYTSLTHVDVASVPQLLANGPELIIFDVREAVEYEVSHIPGAIRVDPGISAVDFMQRFGRQIADKQVLFYCSVGRRASRLAIRVERPLAAAGVRIHNLSGGIFRWFGDQQPLEDSAGNTVAFIHPYNQSVGTLMPRANPSDAPSLQMLP